MFRPRKPRNMPKDWVICNACHEWHVPETTIGFWIFHRLPKKYRGEFMKRWTEYFDGTSHAVMSKVQD